MMPKGWIINWCTPGLEEEEAGEDDPPESGDEGKPCQGIQQDVVELKVKSRW